MRASNPGFDVHRLRDAKNVIYLLEIFDAAGTSVQEKFVNRQHPTISARAILEPPRSTSQKIKPEEGRSAISSISFGLLDDDVFVTQLIQANSLRGRKVNLRIGFAELAEADFLTFFIGFIENVTVKRGLIGYRLEARDVQLFTKESLFEPGQSELANPLGVSDVTADMVDSSGFPDPTLFSAFTKFYFSADGVEILSYTGRTGNQLTGVVHAQFGTTAVAHPAGKKTNEFIVIGDGGGVNPMTALLQILTSTGTPGLNGTFDVFPANWGLAVDQADIAVTDIEAKRDAQIPGLLYQFNIAQRENAQRFISNEFFRNLGAYPIVNGEGKYSVRFFTRPLPASDLQKLDTTTLRAVRGMNLNLDRTYNNLAWDFDWDPLAKEFNTRKSRTDASSIAEFGKQPLRVYQSKGMRTALSSSTFIDDRSGVIFFRFGEPPPTMRFTAHLSEILLEAGDHVFFSHPVTPDVRQGVRGIGFATMEVTERKINLARSSIEGTIQFISATINFANWGPEDLVDAGSETDENRARYAHYADAAGLIAPPGGVGARVDGDAYFL